MGCKAIGPEPEDFLDMGPEPLFLPTGPELGPDLNGGPVLCEEEEGREFLGSIPGMSNILPSSPDFFGSLPVYGTERDDIVGWRSLSCSGRPET